MNFSQLNRSLNHFRRVQCVIFDGIISSRSYHYCWKTVPKLSAYRCISTSQPYREKLKSETTTDCNVYIGPLTKQIRHVKLFSLMTSAIGVIAQPMIFERANELGTSTPALVAVCSIVGFFTFVTPFLLHLITRKYITSVSYNPYTNSYKATTYNVFVRPHQHEFKPGEMSLLNSPSMFGNVSLKGQPLFLDSRFFDDLDHYKKIMGFDKPMDFKLGQSKQ